MEQIRMLQPLDYEQAVQLSDKVFRNSRQISMEHGFPYLFSPVYAHSYGVFRDDKLIAHMGLLPAKLRIGAARLPVFSLGSVCTEPEARGSGVATELLHRVMRHVDDMGAALLFISGGRSLYRRNRCYSFGRLTAYTLTAETSRDAAMPKAEEAANDDRLRELSSFDCFAFHDLTLQHKAAFDMSVWDLGGLKDAAAYASCLEMKPKLYGLERGGALTAYAYVLKPKPSQTDRLPIVLEYGGADAVQLVRLLQSVPAYERLKVIVPWQDDAMHREMSACPAQVRHNDGTVYVPSMARLIRLLRDWWQSFGSPAARIEADDLGDGQVRLRYPDAEAAVLSEEETIRLLFEPEADIPLPESWPGDLRITVPLPPLTGLYYI
ncbi:GNAT family N-acetyltransferase [Paenibacillus thiaminolyticus]|uniref:GNAT family N-acetyltransferase n=1 Tax=Paenibacillus thiaminolyticus TaxID=49283 RepID=UPI003D2E2BE0